MKGKVLQAIIEIAGSVSPTLAKAVKETGDKLDKVNLKVAAIFASAAAGAVGVAKAAIDAGKYLANLGDEYSQAVNDVASTTGAIGEELEALADVVKDVYGSNFGESMGDVASGVAEIHKQTGLAEEALAETTKAAYALSDTFGYEVTESARAAKAMMTNFGITGEEAMNLIAAGAQNGLDYSGEMIDSINEYSVQFAKLGFSADDMFNIFQQGADSGAWNLDKVGDAVKEFSIRSIDGSKTTEHAFQSLGLNADKMMQTFAAGGDGAAYAFQDVLDKLIDMDDAVKRDAIGVELFGTQWEDLGVEAMAAMADMQIGAYDTGDALAGIMDVKYDNIDAVFEAIKRQVEVSFLPLATTVTNAVMSIMPIVGDLFESLGPTIEDLTATLTPLIEDCVAKIGPMLADFLPQVASIASEVASKLLPPLVEIIMSILPALISLADMLLPVIEIIAESVLPSVVTVIQSLLPAVLSVIEAVMPIIEMILPALAELLQFLAPIISWIADLFAERLGHAISAIQPILSALTGMLGNLIDFIKNVFAGNWSEAWENVVDMFKGYWEYLKAIFKAPLNFMIDGINLLIGGLNKLTIPDWVPGIGGKGLNIPLIPKLASGGFTDGISIAGEAGMEAVISFDPAFHEENVGYWMQAGKILGVLDDIGLATGAQTATVAAMQMAEAETGAADAPKITQAGKLMGLDDFSLGQLTETTIIYYDFSGFSYAPQVEAGDDADKDDILAALKTQASEFFDWLEEWIRQKEVGEYDRVSIY